MVYIVLKHKCINEHLRIEYTQTPPTVILRNGETKDLIAAQN